ncbi:MAG: membrane protein insertase YidC [Eubacterium sp.]|nr:membrane protein insertase YidC [Eubacterium sp.]
MIEPLQILFEIIFALSNDVIKNSGLTIIVLSLAMNFLVFPLYRRADAMQEEQREIEKKLEKGVNHIKKTFKGDERMMMLQTYYRQNDYKPVYALKSAASLLLQIPFFIAAYRFLSTLNDLNGASLGFIEDLSKPDGLITLFGLSINILPFLMTGINLISSFIYSKGYPIKTKIQLFAMAAFFLVFLYNSPSGLVFYWTLNNAFSFLKTIVLKTKNPKASAVGISSVLGFVLIIIALLTKQQIGEDYFPLAVSAFVILQMPLLFYRLKVVRSKNVKSNGKVKALDDYKPNYKLFISCSLFMSVFIGVFIPSNIITSSPQEFVFLRNFLHPDYYILSSFLIAFGTFVLWCGVFYYFFDNKKKVKFEKLMLIIIFCALVNYMFFGKHTGTLNSSLNYVIGFFVAIKEVYINIAVVIVVIAVSLTIYKLFSAKLRGAIIVGLIALLCVSSYNIYNINNSVSSINIDDVKESQSEFSIDLSKNGNNVVFIMLDRAMGEYIPYIINEKPEITDMYDGFTYYSNVISFGAFTNFATPALFGGYEYTPTQLNTRKDESLGEKQNESLLVMPSIFDKNGFNVTVCNPTYAGYQFVPDLSIFDEYDNIKKYNISEDFIDEDVINEIIDNNKRNFFVHSLMKSSPIVFQPYLYLKGSYCMSGVFQNRDGLYKSKGVNIDFLLPYSVLELMPENTVVNENTNGNFLFLTNDTTHNPQYLQTPEYVISENVDNSDYYLQNEDLFIVDGKKLKMENEDHLKHYQSNMGALLRLGEWFEYLKKEGVYDNTRIIIAADHGAGFDQIDGFIKRNTGNYVRDLNIDDLEYYFPLLLVKDFNSKGFTISYEFMTNADVPTIAFEGLIDNPTNPFTGNEINNQEKYNHNQYVIASGYYSIYENYGNQFLPAEWYSIHDNIWDKNNWQVVAEDAILTNDDVK